MKFSMTLIAAVILAVGSRGAARAQEGTVRLDIRLTVVEAPCPNATYWLFVRPTEGGPGFGAGYVQLTDGDGDRVYTVRIPDVGVILPFALRLEQGIGTATESSFGVFPGAPSSSITELGDIRQPGSYTFEAQVRGCQTGLPPTGGHDRQMVAVLLSAFVVGGVGAALRRRGVHSVARR